MSTLFDRQLIKTVFFLMAFFAALPNAVYAQNYSSVPTSAGEALRSGWKILDLSSSRSTGINTRKDGGIFNTYHYVQDAYLMQKGNEFIICRKMAHTDTPNGEWRSSVSCSGIE
jgi:hypothetical protein